MNRKTQMRKKRKKKKRKWEDKRKRKYSRFYGGENGDRSLQEN